MRELSIFIDESGTQVGTTSHYLIALVLHDQNADLSRYIDDYTRSLAARGLPDIPFHLTPLLNGHDLYATTPIEIRRQLFGSFSTFVRRLPVTYAVIALESRYFRDPDLLVIQLRRALVDLLVDHHATFLAFDRIKVFYDNGQSAVSTALRKAFRFAFSKQAVLYPETDYRSYRLAQVADYLCGIEFAALKYAAGAQTATDERFFGQAQSFRRNYLKQARRKRMN